LDKQGRGVQTMLSEVLKPNLEALQGDVIDLLQQISLLMNRASTELSYDDSRNNNQ
jgi:hypothetical protein